MALKSDEYFDRSETLPAADRKKMLDERLKRHVQISYRYSDAARALLDRAGLKPEDIGCSEDLAHLPVTGKEDVIRTQQEAPPYGGLLTVPVEEVERVFISPGPVYEVQSSTVSWFARAFWAAGFRKGDVVINTFTYHLSPAGMLMHEGLRQCGATVVTAGTGNTQIQLRAIDHLGVSGFIGTPSFLVTLVNGAREAGDFNRGFKIRKAWFTGEPLSPSVRAMLENECAIDTFQAYAVTEPGGAIAYECFCKQGLHLVDDYVVEIVDSATGVPVEPGEVGEVVVTPVQDGAWGLLRFGTGDLSALNTEPCACGRTAPRLTGIVGRTGDAVKVRGMFVVGREVRELLGQFEEVSRYQLEVSRAHQRDRAILKLSLKPGTDTAGLEESIDTTFRSRCRLKLDGIERVPESYFTNETKPIVDTRSWR